MKKLIVKTMATLLSIAIASSLFVGCVKQKTTSEIQSTPSTTNNTIIEANTLPIADPPITLKLYAQNYQSRLIKSYGEMENFKEISQKTGVNIEWIHPIGELNEQFNVMIASGEYPDIIYWNFGTTISNHIKNNVALKLNDYMKYAPNYKKILDENPIVRKQLIMDDGTIPMFAQIDIDIQRLNYNGFQMRQDWLDKLNLKAPETLDDWYSVLTAFKTKDPNGNDKADEIPFGSGSKENGLDSLAGFWGVRDTFYKNPKTGKITHGYLENGFKDYITTMNKWYSENLIDKEYVASDKKGLDSKVLNNIVGSYFGTQGSYMDSYNQVQVPKDPNFRMVGVPFPKSSDGKAYHTTDHMAKYVQGYGGIISSSCKNPVEAVKFCDYLYSKEGLTYQNWGIEGKSYTIENGKKKLTDAILKSSDGKTPGQAMIKYANPSNGFMKIMDFEYTKAIGSGAPDYVTKPTADAQKLWEKADLSLTMPILTLTSEEIERYSNIMSEISTYSSEKINKFIMGIEPLSNYSEFVNTLKSMELEEAVKIQQAAYDRYEKRK